MRLIAAAADARRSFFRAGAEIRLDPGAITYWRNPGEAGTPPVFVFDGSENVADVTVLYPAPIRIDESGTEVFGYEKAVIFPLHVTPKDGSRPSLLALTLRYAVCGRICLPAKAEAKLKLPPLKEAVIGAGFGAGGAQEAAIAAAEAKAPMRLSDRERAAKIAIARDKGAPAPTWRLTLRGGEQAVQASSVQDSAIQDGVTQDLFAEAPEGWYFETRKTDRPSEFLIVEVERPKLAAGAAPPVILTLTQPRQNYEFAVDLDAATADP